MAHNFKFKKRYLVCILIQIVYYFYHLENVQKFVFQFVTYIKCLLYIKTIIKKWISSESLVN